MLAHETDTDKFLAELLSGQLLGVLLELVPESRVFVKDRQSRFMAASEGFARMMGAGSVEEILGKTDYDYSADFLAEAFIADDRRVIRTGKAIRNKVELVPSGDSLDWHSTTKISLNNEKGDVIGLAGVTRVLHDSDELYRDHPEMHRIIEFISGNFRGKVAIADMARAAGISISSVERLFRKMFGVTPLMYLRKTRLNAACRLLRQNGKALASIAEECGFNDQPGMTRAFRQELKITPHRYRQRYSEMKQKTS